MTILEYIGFGFSLLLFIGAMVFNIIGLYVSRYFNQKTAKLYTRYCVLAGVSAGLSIAILTLMLNGFSWRAVVLAIVLFLLLALSSFYLGHEQEKQIK